MTDNIPENERPKDEAPDLAAEFAELGKKIRDAVSAAWESEERQKLQSDLTDGLDRLSKELSQATQNVRESDVGQKVEKSVKQVRQDVESGKVTDDIRKGMISALRGLGAALDKMAESFTPVEEPPKE
jgi:vancomycin resistance protein YoaR